MGRKRNPERDKAFEIYKQYKGNIQNREIANILGVPEKSVGGWKCKDKWNKKLNGILPKSERNTPIKKLTPKQEKKELKNLDIEEAELTEKQKLFCLYYVKCFNATQSAIKAGYVKDSAHVEGHRLLRNPKIRAEITRLKGSMTQELLVSAIDILNKYAEIAFADVGDYVTFGRREEQVMGMYGPVYNGKGKDKKPVMQMVNYVDLSDDTAVDTSVISEVKQGRDGISIKLADKMKALEKLEQYFDLLPDQHKRKMMEEKLAIERQKLEIDRTKAGLNEDDEDETGIVEIPELAAVDPEEGIDLGTLDLDKPELGGGSGG